MSFVEEAMGAFRRGETADVAALSRDELERARAAEDVSAEVDALCMLSRVAIREGDLDEGTRLAQEAHAVASQSGDVALDQMPLHILAATARLSGDLEASRAFAAQAMEVHRAVGDERMLVIEPHNLAHLELNAGNTERARELFKAAREQAAKLGDGKLLVELAIGIAALNTVDSDFMGAARLLGAVGHALQATGRVLDPDDVVEVETLRHKLINALGETGFEREYEKGAGLGLTVLVSGPHG